MQVEFFQFSLAIRPTHAPRMTCMLGMRTQGTNCGLTYLIASYLSPQQGSIDLYCVTHSWAHVAFLDTMLPSWTQCCLPGHRVAFLDTQHHMLDHNIAILHIKHSQVLAIKVNSHQTSSTEAFQDVQLQIQDENCHTHCSDCSHSFRM